MTLRGEWNKRRGARIGIAVVGLAAGLLLGLGAWGQGDGARFVAPDVTGAVDVSYPVNTTTTGMVSLLVAVDETGKPQHATVLQDTPPLTAAAQASVAKWTFKAAMSGGKAVAANFPVHVVFNPYNPGATSVVGRGLQIPPAIPANQGDFMPPQIRLASYAFYPPNTEAQGTVVLSVSVDKSGHATKIKVVHGAAPLSEAAVEAVQQWGFQPAMRGGEAANGRLCIAFVFQRNLS
jgi:protein TonB